MSLILFGVLALVWAALLLPAVRGRRRYPDSPARSVWRFGRAMDVLARSHVSTLGRDGRWVLVPPTNADKERRTRVAAATRRRRCLACAAGSAALTAVPAVLRGGPWWAVQLGADLVLFGYVGVLVSSARRRAGTRRVLALRTLSAADRGLGVCVVPADEPVSITASAEPLDVPIAAAGANLATAAGQDWWPRATTGQRPASLGR